VLSGSNADDEPQPGSSGVDFAIVERAVEAAGFEWTHLRPGVFMNNTLGWAEAIRTEGVVRAAYGNATQTPIDLGDIAAVAARVLVEDGHVGAKYTLSGPAAITQIEQVEAIGAALGRPVRFHELSRAQAVQEWVSAGVPADIAEWLHDGFAESAAHPQVPTGVLEKLIGRPGKTYAEWARDNVDAFR
jgi:uncharacterized protein YbjT (DUF2867 family)